MSDGILQWSKAKQGKQRGCAAHGTRRGGDGILNLVVREGLTSKEIPEPRSEEVRKGSHKDL